MTITIDATYEDGVLKPAQPLPLGEHAQVRVTVESEVAADREVFEPAETSLGDEVAALVAALPAEVVERWPADGASQHDHYIYGTPKRTDLPQAE